MKNVGMIIARRELIHAMVECLDGALVGLLACPLRVCHRAELVGAGVLSWLFVDRCAICGGFVGGATCGLWFVCNVTVSICTALGLLLSKVQQGRTK